jgi:hypothetical protein
MSNTKAQREEKTREYLFSGLKWFEGGTQQRNIGISVIEGHWSAFPSLRSVWRPLLVTQVVHVMTKGDDSETERNNADRMIALLVRDAVNLDREQKRAIHEALFNSAQILPSGEISPTRAKGVALPAAKVARWLEAFV